MLDILKLSNNTWTDHFDLDLFTYGAPSDRFTYKSYDTTEYLNQSGGKSLRTIYGNENDDHQRNISGDVILGMGAAYIRSTP